MNVCLRGRSRSCRAAAYGLLALSLLTGCAVNPLQPTATGTEPAVTGAAPGVDVREAALLAAIADMQQGEQRTINGQTVACEQTFSAASGRVCKYITLRDTDDSGPIRTRLACQDDSNWLFATDVFSSETRSDWHP